MLTRRLDCARKQVYCWFYRKQQNWKANWQIVIDRFKQRITIKIKQEVRETHTLRRRLTKPREQREDREGERARDRKRHTQRHDWENRPLGKQT